MKKKKTVVVIAEIVTIIIIYLFVNSDYIKIIPKCWIYDATKLYCPSCGGTKCIQNIFKGNLIKAFYSNMVIFIGIIYLFIINIIYLFNIKNKKLTWLYPKWWYVIIFELALIIYTIFRNIML